MPRLKIIPLVLSAYILFEVKGGSAILIGSNKSYDSLCLIDKTGPLRKLHYQDGTFHPVRIPYSAWSSARILGDIVYILLSEIMGYSVVLYETNTLLDDEIVSATAGCFDVDTSDCVEHNNNDPLVHFTLETWQTGYQRGIDLPANVRPVLLGIQRYDLLDQLYIWPTVVESGLRAPEPLFLQFYRSYNASSYRPHVHFDSLPRLLELLPRSVVIPCSSMGPNTTNFRDTELYTRVTGDSEVDCLNNTAWLAPGCRRQPASCVPLLLQYNFQQAMQLAHFLNFPLAIVMVGPGAAGRYLEYYRAIREGRFLFGWYQPDDSLVDSAGRLPVPLTLPQYDSKEQDEGIFRTGGPQVRIRRTMSVLNPRPPLPMALNLLSRASELPGFPRSVHRAHVHAQHDGLSVYHCTRAAQLKAVNYGWRQLPDVDRLVSAFAARVDLAGSDMDALMRASRGLKDAQERAIGGAGGAPEGVSRAVACAWVRGARAVWGAWIPAVCPEGSVVDEGLQRCPSRLGLREARGEGVPRKRREERA